MLSLIYTFKKGLMSLILLGICLITSALQVSGLEISITTNSQKARDQFIDGRDKIESIQLVRAAELLDQAISLDQNFALAHIYRALTGVGGFNVVRKHADMAAKLVDQVTEGERDLILFNVAIIDGNQMKQKVFLDKLLTGFPEDKRVQVWAGIYFYTTKDFKTAKTHLMVAINLDKTYAPPYNLLGYTEIGLNDMNSAENNFKKYISLLPNSPNPYDSYAELLLKQGKYDASIQQYQMALDKDPRFTNALIGIGNNYVFKNNFEEARKFYQKSYDMSTNVNTRLTALSWITTSFVHEGKIQNALEVTDQALKLAKDNNLITNMINIYNSRGFILTEAGMIQDGLDQYKSATELIMTSNLPMDTKETLTIQTDLNKCYTLVSNNMIDEAQKEVDQHTKTINSRGNITEIEKLNTNIGLIELKRGNFQTALNHLNKADVNSELNQYYRGLVYQKMGNNTKAQECFTKVKNSRNNSIGLAVVRSRPTE